MGHTLDSSRGGEGERGRLAGARWEWWLWLRGWEACDGRGGSGDGGCGEEGDGGVDWACMGVGGAAAEGDEDEAVEFVLSSVISMTTPAVLGTLEAAEEEEEEETEDIAVCPW